MEIWQSMNNKCTILDYIYELYREIYREKIMASVENPHSAPNDRKDSAGPNRNNRGSRRNVNRRKTACLEPCGEIHYWGECKYLNWAGLNLPKPDDDKMKAIEQLLEDKPGLSRAVKDSLRRHNKWFRGWT
jgi:hypothetical protein